VTKGSDTSFFQLIIVFSIYIIVKPVSYPRSILLVCRS